MANRSYTAEFRAQAVELSYLPDKTVSGVARDLGVNPKTLHFWRHQARKNGTVHRAHRYDRGFAAPATSRGSL